MAVLAAWENRIISGDCNPAQILTLGCFLIATMASLRFRDMLRTKPESLGIQGHILRGISWLTKTSVSGQPWGVCCLGIATRPSSTHWIFRFLEIADSGIGMSRQHWGKQWNPDFLLPSWTTLSPSLRHVISSSSCLDQILCPMQLATTASFITRSGTETFDPQYEVNIIGSSWTAQPQR